MHANATGLAYQPSNELLVAYAGSRYCLSRYDSTWGALNVDWDPAQPDLKQSH